MESSGKLIVIEGLDGSGQSTHVARLAEHLKVDGHKVLVTKEPTNNIVGGIIRGALTKDWKSSNACLQLLFAADRLHHLEREILPALANGAIVISDRYMYSSIAYGGIDLDPEWINAINAHAVKPDLVIYIRVPPEVCMQRMMSGRMSLELFEEKAKLEKVFANYDKIVTENSNFAVVDGNKSIDEVFRSIRAALKEKLGL